MSLVNQAIQLLDWIGKLLENPNERLEVTMAHCAIAESLLIILSRCWLILLFNNSSETSHLVVSQQKARGDQEILIYRQIIL